jgi:hypothetical protein
MGIPVGQPARDLPTVRAVLWLLGLIAISTLGCGCSSIYHRTRAHIPPEPMAELSLRVAEARRAERLAQHAGVKLLENLRGGELPSITQSDFDRLEAATVELERRVLAADNALEQTGGPPDVAEEIDRLRRQWSVWWTYVEANRATDSASRLEQLDALVRGSL